MPTTFANGYALLIGVGKTEYSKWSLPVTVKDAEALRAILTDPNLCAYSADNVKLRQDSSARREDILQSLSWLKEQAAADAEATVVVFYAGHGWLDQTTSQYYLIPHDTDPVDIPGTGLSADEFTMALREIKAQRLLVILDCCHAEGMATSRGEKVEIKLPRGFERVAPPPQIVETLKQGEGRAIYSSSRGSQLSWERLDGKNGIFTYHLLEALRGAGNQPGDPTVRLSNLQNYLGKAVPESARLFAQAEQTPFFDTATEDFPVATLRGGRGLPTGGWEAVKAEIPSSKYGVQIGDVRESSVNVGDKKIEQTGKFNLNADRISGAAVGDGAQVHNYSKPKPED